METHGLCIYFIGHYYQYGHCCSHSRSIPHLRGLVDLLVRVLMPHPCSHPGLTSLWSVSSILRTLSSSHLTSH